MVDYIIKNYNYDNIIDKIKQLQDSMLSKNILHKFRQVMKLRSTSIYLLPRTDQYQSQYISPCSQRVRFLSGFSGSNAFALISNKQALLWTDGRYFLQAQSQLYKDWQMKRMIQPEKKWFQHISQNYEPSNTKIQIDGRLITANNAKQRKKYLQEKGFQLNFAEQNLVDFIWDNRPKSQMKPIYIHQQWAGRSMSEKVNWVRSKIKQKDGQAAIFTDLGQIAWILNLRSQQIPYNPFFKGTLLIMKQSGYLQLPKTHPSFQSKQIRTFLQRQEILIQQYQGKLPNKILCQSGQINYSLYSKIKHPIQWDGIGLYRAVRTQKQIDGFKRCHLVDGVALAKFWAWRSGQDSINQYEAACYLDRLRYQQKLNKGLSFATISGGGPNGAIIHYHATPEKSSIVTRNMIHLVDSGGQYLDGTTDVTRAFHFGSPTQQQKDAYTRVLLGNLDIQRLRWPKKVKLTGKEIQVLARRHLWKSGKQYTHGTGHGVGYFGSVHEGPVGISRINNTVFEPNMIVTNQPGYYEAGKFGIRIQNMLIVRELNGQSLGFENLTLCPYDKNLIDMKLLTKQDVCFINEYHQKVFKQIFPFIKGDEVTNRWLRQATLPLQYSQF